MILDWQEFVAFLHQDKITILPKQIEYTSFFYMFFLCKKIISVMKESSKINL